MHEQKISFGAMLLNEFILFLLQSLSFYCPEIFTCSLRISIKTVCLVKVLRSSMLLSQYFHLIYEGKCYLEATEINFCLFSQEAEDIIRRPTLRI